jgi:tetratricopeptide (TPR) repeat protein
MIGMVIHLQILPLEMTVAIRWFYFPVIGLLGMIGVIINSFWQYKNSRIFFVCVFIVALTTFSFQTVNRLRDWKDATTLYSQDISQTQSHLLEHSLGYELLQQGKLAEAHQHFKTSVDLFATPINTNSMGVYYYKMKNIPEAKRWFYRSNSLGDYFLAYQNQARLLLGHDKVEVAQPYIERAIKKYPQSDVFWYLLAIANYKKGDTTGALEAAEKAYSMSPNKENTYVVSQLRNNLPIKIND